MNTRNTIEAAVLLGAHLDELAPTVGTASMAFNRALGRRFLAVYPELASAEVDAPLYEGFEAWVRARLLGWPVWDLVPSEGARLYGPPVKREELERWERAFARVRNIDLTTLGREATVPSAELPIADDLLMRIEVLARAVTPRDTTSAERLPVAIRAVLERGLAELEREHPRPTGVSVAEEVARARRAAGLRLRRWRQAAKRSPAELAEELAVFEDTWLAIERGEADPGMLRDVIESIAGIPRSAWSRVDGGS